MNLKHVRPTSIGLLLFLAGHAQGAPPNPTEPPAAHAAPKSFPSYTGVAALPVAETVEVTAELLNATPFVIGVTLFDPASGTIEAERVLGPGSRLMTSRRQDASKAAALYARARTLPGETPLLASLYSKDVVGFAWPNEDTSGALAAINDETSGRERYYFELEQRGDHRQTGIFTVPGGFGFSATRVWPGASATDTAQCLVEAQIARRCIAISSLMNDHIRKKGASPFVVGFYPDAKDDITEIGLPITGAVPKLSNGNQNPLRAGDVLLAVNGRPIYTLAGAQAAIWDHARSRATGGVRRPITILWERGGEYYESGFPYFIVKERLKGHADYNWNALSFFMGLADGITLGFDEDIFARRFKKQLGVSHQDAVWLYRQIEAMVAQWEKGAYRLGSIGSFGLSVSRGAVKLLGSRNARRFARSKVGAVALETAENLVWTFKDGGEDKTAKELLEEFKWALGASTAGAILPGMILRK